MDADVIILDDLAKLWHHPIEGQSVVAAKTNADMTRLCTCVWDCKAAKNIVLPIKKLKKDPKSHKEMMAVFKDNNQLIEPYQDSYNCIDGENLALEDIRILHYSDMGTQFSHKYSLPRVSEEGIEHWFDGEIMSHPRQDLSEVFDEYYNEALAAGYDLDSYRVEPFGHFPKKSQEGYTGNKVTRPHASKSFFSKLFKR